MDSTVASHAEEHHELDPAVSYSASKLGMWLFLGTEILLFGGLFATYAIYRARYPEMFAEQHRELDVWFGTINTFILLFSSFTMAMAVWSIQKSKKKATVIFMIITIICGLAFGVNKYFEYAEDFHKHLYPQTSIFYALYYLMTGLHMIHVFVGLCILSVITYLTHKGKFDKDYYTPVEVGGLYWHLVDVIWIYLFPLLYLIA